MKLQSCLLTSLLTVGVVLTAGPTWGHQGELDGGGLHAGSDRHGNRVQASVVVPGTVAELKGELYRLERWPQVFSDVKSLVPLGDGTWSVDFQRFGHPHDFRAVRTATGVVWRLAARDHGDAALEYALEPVDARRSRLTVRFLVPTPPQLTAEQMVGLLRAKARADLDDFSKRANDL